MATVSHYEMHLGTNSYYVASNPQLSPMYDKSKKSWSQRLKITKTEKITTPMVPVTPTHQQLNEFATFEYGPSGALSRSMKYAEPWLYSTVRGIPAIRPTVHYHHNGHPTAIFTPIPAEVAVVICSCPEYLTGTKRDVKKASVCKKCKGSRLPLAPIGGTVRLRPTSTPVIHQQRISAATLRLPSTTKSRPSILDTQNDPYDMMRRTRLLSPDPPRESLKISNSRHIDKNQSSNSKNQNGTMGKNTVASRGRSRYRTGNGTSISSTTTNISAAAISTSSNNISEQEMISIAKTATIRSRSASRGKTPQPQKAIRDRWSDAGGDMQIDPGGRRSILECNVNPYELISCGTMNANNEFSPPDSDDMFDLPLMRTKSNSDAVAIAAAAAAALIKEKKNSSLNKGKKLGYSNIQAIAGQRIILGEEKVQSKLIANGENFHYEDIEVQAQISPVGGSSKNVDISLEEKETVKQLSVNFAVETEDDLSPTEFVSDGKAKFHPKRPPRKKHEISTGNSIDDDAESSIQNNISNSSSLIHDNSCEMQSSNEQNSDVSTPTTPTTVPFPKQQTIKSILKRPSSVSSSLSTTSSISDNDAKNTINQTTSTSFKSYINSSSVQSDSILNSQIDNITTIAATAAKKFLATGNSLKKFNSQTSNQNQNILTKDNNNCSGITVNFNAISDLKNNSLDSCNVNNNNNSNNKRNSGSGSQFYLPMPSQPTRKKVQFMVEDKIIQDDPEDDKNDSSIEFDNSNVKNLQNKNVAFIDVVAVEDSIKENQKSNDYPIKNGHNSNEEFSKVENFQTNNKISSTNNNNIRNNSNDENDDFDEITNIDNDDVSMIKNKNKSFNNGNMNRITNGKHQFSDVENQNCHQLMLILEQQKVQSEILDLLHKQTNDLLKNSKDSNSFNHSSSTDSRINSSTYTNNDNMKDDLFNNKRFNIDSNETKITINGNNSLLGNESNADCNTSAPALSNKFDNEISSNISSLRRTYSDRRANLGSNNNDLNQKIQFQFNDTMALRLKNNRTVASQDLFTQEQLQYQQNEKNLNCIDEKSIQQNTFYRPKEPPPPPPPATTTTTTTTTQTTKSSTNKFSPSSSSSSIASPSSSIERNYENKNSKNNDNESSLMLEMHSNELLQTMNLTKNCNSSSKLKSEKNSSSTSAEINKTTNSIQGINDVNNSQSTDIINRNGNNVNNSKRNIDKIKTATKTLQHNQNASQTTIVSQSKVLQKQQQQMKSSLLSTQQRRQSLEQQNVHQQEQKSKVVKTPSKENLKGISTIKTKRVSWAGTSDKIQENSKELSRKIITKEITKDENIKVKSNNYEISLNSTQTENDKNHKGINENSNEITNKAQKLQQQQPQSKSSRPTSLPLTPNNNNIKCLNEEKKLLQAQNEISTGARLFGNSNKLLVNPIVSPDISLSTSVPPPPLHQQHQTHQRTVVRVAPFNTTPTTPTNTANITKEIHRLKIKHTDDINHHNGISNGFIDESNDSHLNNTSNDVGSFNNNQKKTSILINGDDCYSTVNVSNDTPIYQSSVVVTDGTTPILSVKTSDNIKTSNTRNNLNAEGNDNSQFYPSNTVTINVNSNKTSSINTNTATTISSQANNNKNKHKDLNSSEKINVGKSLEDEIIYKNNKLNTLLSMNSTKSIIPINGNLMEVTSNTLNGNSKEILNEECGNETICNQKQQLKATTKRNSKGTLITLDFEKESSRFIESTDCDEVVETPKESINGNTASMNLSHEEELVKILRNPVEAVKRNLVPHVCGKSDIVTSLNTILDDNNSTVSTPSRTSSTSTLATVLDEPLITKSLSVEKESSTTEKSRDRETSMNSIKSDKNSLIGRLLEDPTLSHLADGLENDVIVKLIESSLKRLKQSRTSIDTSGTKDNEDMTRLIDISLQKIKEERYRIESGHQQMQNNSNSSNLTNSHLNHSNCTNVSSNNNKSAIEEQQESQSNRGSISSGNSYTSANYELFEFEANNESDCYQSCSSEITNCDEESTSTQSKFYQMLVDATLSEIEISANNDEEHHYESIRLNSDPIYEEISEIPPPLPLSPPPVNEGDFERKSSKSMFEGASKYDILSYLVDAKERGIVKEDNFDYTFSNGINDIILEEDKITDSISANNSNKELRHQRNHNLQNSSSSNNNIVSNNKNGNSNSELNNRNSHLSITSESSEDTHSLSSSINEKLLTPNNSATNTLTSIGSQRSKPSTIDIERNDSGVGSETSKSSRSKYQNPPAACLLDKNSPIHLCEDCDGPVETQITDSGVMYAPLVCRKCGKKRAERKEIITEIVETEEKYGRDLQIILEEFCQPMLVAGLLTQEQLSAIFLNTEELLENNQTLAERMRDALDIALEQGDDDLLTVNIGKIFLESTQMLHAFESYCVRQAAASLLLANLEKEKELLRIFLRVSQMENTVLRRMNLNSFLMVPVQRVTKYPLLLARLFKVTPVHLDGRELLKQAQEKIELHLNHMNQEAKDVPTKLWRRISSSSPNRRASCEIDMINIKLRKMAIDVLEWNHDEVRFTMEGKLLFTQPTDSNWKKGRTIKLTPVNALLVTNGKPSSNYKSEKAYADQLHFPKHTGIREASLLLVKEKCGRYTLIREPLYMDRCIVCTEADWEDYFEVHEISSKDTFIFKAEDGVRTKHWYKQLQYHSQCMGAWRKRRNALANIMINGMLSRT
ncbi:putative uncharacterized protein DDB_G0282133 [Condylostylus longicornis]|uniref:putative uncharacterized protein DDB_G0282133 n=1 Tax=Condylostylus longicornis TaxID=2530218 RepID=UPI00244E56E4|nr:putative uncharacterized protein DDB_G0282133 [Condylostylus longicornis]XP_055383506.1 putative uncharacterized protein DDB_G0282133 [Condylostylus longicornis]